MPEPLMQAALHFGAVSALPHVENLPPLSPGVDPESSPDPESEDFADFLTQSMPPRAAEVFAGGWSDSFILPNVDLHLSRLTVTGDSMSGKVAPVLTMLPEERFGDLVLPDAPALSGIIALAPVRPPGDGMSADTPAIPIGNDDLLTAISEPLPDPWTVVEAVSRLAGLASFTPQGPEIPGQAMAADPVLPFVSDQNQSDRAVLDPGKQPVPVHAIEPMPETPGPPKEVKPSSTDGIGNSGFMGSGPDMAPAFAATPFAVMAAVTPEGPPDPKLTRPSEVLPVQAEMRRPAVAQTQGWPERIGENRTDRFPALNDRRDPAFETLAIRAPSENSGSASRPVPTLALAQIASPPDLTVKVGIPQESGDPQMDRRVYALGTALDAPPKRQVPGTAPVHLAYHVPGQVAGLPDMGSDHDLAPHLLAHDPAFSLGPDSGQARAETVRIPMANLTQVVVQVTHQLLHKPDGTAILTLSPDELGRVKVSFKPGQAASEQMTVILTFDRAETLELFRRHANQLEDALGQAGYADVLIDFGTMTGEGSQGRADSKADERPDQPGQLDLPAGLALSLTGPVAGPVAGPGVDPISGSTAGLVALDLRL